MPRVHSQTKSARGAVRSCGRCGRPIREGETYFKFSFRYGGTHFRCGDHYPKRSELTQSKLSTVYSAIEACEDALPGCTTIEEIEEAVTTVGEAAREVADEYYEASEPFNYEGENAERSEELGGFADELESFTVDTELPEVDGDEVAQGLVDDGADEEADDWAGKLKQAVEDAEKALPESEEYEEALEAARDEAREAIGECPL